jgi:glycosyltransferase involved in cell wall biosynthesis
MKVAFVTDALHLWGAETSLLEYLREMGPSACALVHPQSPLLKIPEIRLSVQSAPMARRRSRDGGGLGEAPLQFPIDALSWVWGAIRLAPSLRRFDVVVCYGTWELGQVLLASLLARRPCFIDLHETFRPGRQRRILAWLARKSAGVVTPTLSLAREFGLEEEAVVIPRPVNVRSVPRAERPVQVRVCMLGQIVKHKRVLEVATAVGQMNAENVVLDVYGAHPGQASDYQRSVEEAGGVSVVVHERTSDVAAALAAADVLVNASEHEAFGRTVVEAMQGGVWPIVCGSGGPREIVSDAGIGSLLNGPNDLVDELARVSRWSDQTWREASEQCRTAGDAYRSDQIVPRYIEFLRRASSL